MTIAEVKSHPVAYTILLILMVSVVIFSMVFLQSRIALRLGFLAFGFLYFVWGILTHSKSSSVTVAVMTEYAGVALLGTLLLLLLTI